MNKKICWWCGEVIVGDYITGFIDRGKGVYLHPKCYSKIKSKEIKNGED